jgi:hypothetical protein
MVADPSHGQVGQNVASGFQSVDLPTALGGSDEGGMRLANALGHAGGAGGIEHDRNIVGPPLGHLGVEEIRMVAVVNPPHLHQGMDIVEVGLIVMTHASRIVVDDMLQQRHSIHDVQQLVHLLLVLDRGKANGRVLEDEQHFIRHRVLIERHRNAAEALGGAHHHVEMGSVVADDG